MFRVHSFCTFRNDSKKHRFESISLTHRAYLADGQTEPMRPKARGLVQHGGPPGRLEKIDPARVILYVMDGL